MLPNHHAQKEGLKIGIAHLIFFKQNQNKMVLRERERESERANHGFIYVIMWWFGIFGIYFLFYFNKFFMFLFLCFDIEVIK